MLRRFEHAAGDRLPHLSSVDADVAEYQLRPAPVEKNPPLCTRTRFPQALRQYKPSLARRRLRFDHGRNQILQGSRNRPPVRAA